MRSSTRWLMACLVAAVIAVSADHCMADGALAIGLLPRGPSGGFVFGVNTDSLHPATRALSFCRGIDLENSRMPERVSEAQNACRTVATFHEQCVAISFNGDRRTASTGVGWAISSDTNAAADRAIAQCDAMRKGVGQRCPLYIVICDGDRSTGDFAACQKAAGEAAIAACTRALDRYAGREAQTLHFLRSVAYIYAGSLPSALADLNQASELDREDSIAALWLDIVAHRSNLDSRLAQSLSSVDMTVWPAPIIRLYLNQMTPAAVLAAAGNADAEITRDHACQANFYSGVLAVRQNRVEEAKRLLQAAADGCRHNVVEWVAANKELDALRATP